MRPMLRFLRAFLRSLRWLGLGLSTILLVATLVLWVRSWGHREGWSFGRFEPRPDWTAPEVAGQGIHRFGVAKAIHGRLWLGSGTRAPAPEFKPRIEYRRDPCSADEAKQYFDWLGDESAWDGGDLARRWRFAGAGFLQGGGDVDPQIGRPPIEGFQLVLPFWMLAVAFGLWPGVVVGRRLLRRKRHARGLCPTCGYDLRATPDRCPECGRTAIKA